MFAKVHDQDLTDHCAYKDFTPIDGLPNRYKDHTGEKQGYGAGEIFSYSDDHYGDDQLNLSTEHLENLKERGLLEELVRLNYYREEVIKRNNEDKANVVFALIDISDDSNNINSFVSPILVSGMSNTYKAQNFHHFLPSDKVKEEKKCIKSLYTYFNSSAGDFNSHESIFPDKYKNPNTTSKLIYNKLLTDLERTKQWLTTLKQSHFSYDNDKMICDTKTFKFGDLKLQPASWGNMYHDYKNKKDFESFMEEHILKRFLNSKSDVNKNYLFFTEKSNADKFAKLPYYLSNKESSLRDSKYYQGIFDSALSYCFADSEQALLTFMSRLNSDTHKTKLYKLNNSQNLLNQESYKINFTVFSTNDICQFCRGTFSCLLHNGWLRSVFTDWLSNELDANIEPILNLNIFGVSLNEYHDKSTLKGDNQ